MINQCTSGALKKNIAENVGVFEDRRLWKSFRIRIGCMHTHTHKATISAASLTFRLQFQTGMWAHCWVWKPVAVYDL